MNYGYGNPAPERVRFYSLLLAGPVPAPDLLADIGGHVDAGRAVTFRRTQAKAQRKYQGSAGEKAVPLAEEVRRGRRLVAKSCLRVSERCGMVTVRNGLVTLTSKGEKRATKLVRRALNDSTP